MRYLTQAEQQTASHFLFLSMAILVIEQDMEHVRQGTFKIREPYMEMLEKMASDASRERRQLRKAMHHKKIKIVPYHQNDSFSTFLFQCHGKEEKRSYFNPVIRKKVETIMRKLMAKALSPEHDGIAADV